MKYAKTLHYFVRVWNEDETSSSLDRMSNERGVKNGNNQKANTP